MEIQIPEKALVLMMGASGSGKSTFVRKHFKDTQVVSSDACRAMVADDPGDQSATPEAFEILNLIADARLKRGNLTVADATSVQPHARKKLLQLARRHNLPCVVLALDLPEEVCQERNAAREDRRTPHAAVKRQCQDMEKALRGAGKEGFQEVHILSATDMDEAKVVLTPLPSNMAQDHGPFDLIGDVHGCIEELLDLLTELGYEISEQEFTSGGREFVAFNAEGRKAVFVGDLVDRGPGSHRVLQLAMDMVGQGTALCIMGNHENKLMRHMMGRDVKVGYGLAETLAQMEGEPESFHQDVLEFLQNLPHHLVLDGGRLVVAHAGILEEYQGRDSKRVREFCYYGQTTGEHDEWGIPERVEWAKDYRGRAAVVYGHTVVPEARWQHNTICLDTGAVFGGVLTALKWPERELVQVDARETYYEPTTPLQSKKDNGGTRSVDDLRSRLATAVAQAKRQQEYTQREEGNPADADA